jgi:hypothetical protein
MLNFENAEDILRVLVLLQVPNGPLTKVTAPKILHIIGSWLYDDKTI